jgi:hypothetical protein
MLRLEIVVEGVVMGGSEDEVDEVGEGERWLADPRDVSSGREGDDEGTRQTTGERRGREGGGRKGEKRVCDGPCSGRQ